MILLGGGMSPPRATATETVETEFDTMKTLFRTATTTILAIVLLSGCAQPVGAGVGDAEEGPAPRATEQACVDDDTCNGDLVCLNGTCGDRSAVGAGDGNGSPIDRCETEPDCVLGEACVGGFCEPVAVDIELGVGAAYAKIPPGGELPFVRGFQGFGEVYLSYQTVGFTPNGAATVSVSVNMVDDGTVVLGAFPAEGNPFVEIAPGINQQLDDYWFLFLNPAPLFGREANVVLTITDDADPAISATIQQTVVIVDAAGRS